MGVCQNIPKTRTNLRKNNLNNKEKNEISESLSLSNNIEEFKHLNKNKIEEVDLTSKLSSLYTNNKYDTSPTNISSNSTCVQTCTLNKPIDFIIEATIGEIEIPIMVDKNEKIIIKK